MTRRRLMMLAPFGLRPKGTTIARALPLARRLVQRGWDVKVLAPPFDCPADSGRVEVIDGVEVHHLRMGHANILRWTANMVVETSRFRPALVHLFKPKGCGGLAMPALQSVVRLPVVVDMDDREGTGGWNDLMSYPGYAKWLFQRQEANLPRRAAAVTVASRALETLAWSQGVPPERVFYVPNAVDRMGGSPTRACDASNLGRRFLIYSRFHEFSFDRLMAELAPALSQGSVQLDIAGEVPERLRAMIDPWIANKAIRVHGWVSREQFEDVAAHCVGAIVPCEDSLINRCRCSAKLFELLGMGLPIIAHAVGEVSSVVQHGVGGLLAEPGDYAGLVQLVRSAADDPILLAKLREGAKVRASQSTWDARVIRCEEAYAYACQAG